MNSSQPCFASLSVFCYAKYCFTFKPRGIKAYARVILVGPSGLEPPTSCLSGTRSNLLSYEPISLFALFHFLKKQNLSVFLLGRRNLRLVEMMGFEPMTPCLQGRCSPSWATPPFFKWVSLFSVFSELRAGFTALFSVSALSYLPVQSPVKYFHHCRA